MSADIVGFQEVIHAQALEETLQLAQGYQQTHLVVAPNPSEGHTVALASKFPIIQQQVFTQFPPEDHFDLQGVKVPFQKFSKPILCAEVRLTQALACTIFVTHLKSKRPILPKNCDPNDPIERAKGQVRALILRAAEATALRMILLKTLQGTNHPVMVIGDINDSGLAVTSQIISGDPPRKKQSFRHKQEIWDILLYSVKDLQERQSHGNFYYTYQSLDHILVSQEWVSYNPHRLGQVKYVQVFNDHLVDDTLCDHPIPGWQSDHGQVVAHFSLEKP